MTFWGPEPSQIYAKSAKSGFCDFNKVTILLLLRFVFFYNLWNPAHLQKDNFVSLFTGPMCFALLCFALALHSVGDGLEA